MPWRKFDKDWFILLNEFRSASRPTWWKTNAYKRSTWTVRWLAEMWSNVLVQKNEAYLDIHGSLWAHHRSFRATKTDVNYNRLNGTKTKTEFASNLLFRFVQCWNLATRQGTRIAKAPCWYSNFAREDWEQKPSG